MQELDQLSISRLLEYWSVKNPDAIYCKQIDGESISFGALYNLVGKYAAFLLQNEGINPGDHIVIKVDNSLEFVVAFFAVISIGAVVCAAPASMTDEELSDVISLLDAKLIILRRKIDQKIIGANAIKSIIIESYEQLVSSLIKIDPINLFHDESASYSCIYLSSGTTSKPKAIKHNSRTLAQTAFAFSKRLKFNQNSAHLAFLPCGHSSFIGHSLFPTLVCGATIHIARNYLSISRKIWDYISEENIQYCQTVPTIIGSMLATSHNYQNIKKNNLKFIACGSAPLSKKYIDSFNEKFHIPLINLYGLSEIGAVFYNDPINANFDPCSIGQPFNKVRLKLVTPCGDEVNIEEAGELLIDSPTLFIGYYNKDITLNPFTADGFFRTGDLLSKNSAGNYFFHGRVNELIVRAGINISPREIEELLLSHPKIKDIAIFGYEKDLMGEEICCCYISEDSLDLTDDLENLCRNSLSDVKHPSTYINLKEFPSTYSGKIMKKELKRLFLEGVIF